MIEQDSNQNGAENLIPNYEEIKQEICHQLEEKYNGATFAEFFEAYCKDNLNLEHPLEIDLILWIQDSGEKKVKDSSSVEEVVRVGLESVSKALGFS